MGPKKQQFGFNVLLVVRTTVELPTWYSYCVTKENNYAPKTTSMKKIRNRCLRLIVKFCIWFILFFNWKSVDPELTSRLSLESGEVRSNDWVVCLWHRTWRRAALSECVLWGSGWWCVWEAEAWWRAASAGHRCPGAWRRRRRKASTYASPLGLAADCRGGNSGRTCGGSSVERWRPRGGHR